MGFINSDVDYDELDREQLIDLAKERRQYVIEIAKDAARLTERMIDVNTDAQATAGALEFQYQDMLVQNGELAKQNEALARQIELHERLEQHSEFRIKGLAKLLQFALRKDRTNDDRDND